MRLKFGINSKSKTSRSKKLSLILSTMLLSTVANASTSTCVSGQNYDFSTTCLLPTGVTTIHIDAWGAGGNGSDGNIGTAGSGGGGGSYCGGTFSVTDNAELTLTIGTTGVAHTSVTGGGLSGITANNGDNASGTTRGNGGTTAGCSATNSTSYSGGNGANGDSGNDLGGGGGGSAKATQNGGNAGATSTEEPGMGEGYGGAGASSMGSAMLGMAPGAGGAGGNSANSTASSGVSGRVKLTFSLPKSTPTDINLTNYTIAENSTIGTVIGELNATDSNISDLFTFNFCATDNNFTIDGNKLKTAINLDYETKNSYTTCIRVSDSNSDTFDKNLTINITNVNDVPIWSIENNSTKADTNLTITSLSNYIYDPENNSSIIFSAESNNTNLAIVSISNQTLTISPVSSTIFSDIVGIRLSAYDGENNVSKDINVTITNVNDKPSIILNSDENSTIKLQSNENSQYLGEISTIFANRFDDSVDFNSSTLAGIFVSNLEVNGTKGKWEVKANGGNWQDLVIPEVYMKNPNTILKIEKSTLTAGAKNVAPAWDVATGEIESADCNTSGGIKTDCGTYQPIVASDGAKLMYYDDTDKATNTPSLAGSGADRLTPTPFKGYILQWGWHDRGTINPTDINAIKIKLSKSVDEWYGNSVSPFNVKISGDTYPMNNTRSLRDSKVKTRAFIPSEYAGAILTFVGTKEELEDLRIIEFSVDNNASNLITRGLAQGIFLPSNASLRFTPTTNYIGEAPTFIAKIVEKDKNGQNPIKDLAPQNLDELSYTSGYMSENNATIALNIKEVIASPTPTPTPEVVYIPPTNNLSLDTPFQIGIDEALVKNIDEKGDSKVVQTKDITLNSGEISQAKIDIPKDNKTTNLKASVEVNNNIKTEITSLEAEESVKIELTNDGGFNSKVSNESVTSEVKVSANAEAETKIIVQKRVEVTMKSPKGSEIKQENSGKVTSTSKVNADTGESSLKPIEVKMVAEINGNLQTIANITNENGNIQTFSLALPAKVESGQMELVKNDQNSAYIAIKSNYKTSTNFSLNTNYKRDIVKTIEVVGTTAWQKFEEKQYFNGKRTITLILGGAKIIRDGVEEEMIKDVEYELTPATNTTIDSEINNENNLTKIYINSYLNIQKGWNLISNPIDKELEINSTFKYATQNYKYNGNWIKDSKTLKQNEGMWINYEKHISEKIEGNFYDLNFNNINNSWNLLGAGRDINLNELSLFSQIWVYDSKFQTWIKNPTTIYRGYGFWAR